MAQVVVYFCLTYDETLSLLVEARNYLNYQEQSCALQLPPGARLQFCNESLRVTSRLAHVMAWLLAQRAVHAGEITQDEAASDLYALSGGKVCLDISGHQNNDLPSGLRSLLDRSHRLYVRACRLENMVRHRNPPPRLPMPPRSISHTLLN